MKGNGSGGTFRQTCNRRVIMTKQPFAGRVRWLVNGIEYSKAQYVERGQHGILGPSSRGDHTPC
jgi:hypothetical protein